MTALAPSPSLSTPLFPTSGNRCLLATLRAWFAAEWPFDQVIYPVSQQNPPQAALLSSAGFVEQASLALADGRICRVYAEPTQVQE